MKKIQLYTAILLSALTAVWGCSSAGDEDNDRNNNVIAGTWNSYFENTDSLVMVRVFTSDFYSYFSYADGKPQDMLNKSPYYIDNSHIYMPRYTQTYKLSADSLWITNSKGDQTTLYIRAKNIY